MCRVAILTPQKIYQKKVEMTDSGKFIEVERGETDAEVRPESDDKFDENEMKETEIPVSASPNASPGKTVRIKENGAKANGDTEVLCDDCYPLFINSLLKY